MRRSERRLRGITTRASLRGRSERLTIKTSQLKGMPGLMMFWGELAVLVKVMVTPKSGTEVERWWRVVSSMEGRASGREMASGVIEGTASMDPMEICEGRWSRCIGWLGCPNPGFTGGVKSMLVCQRTEI